jgi:hypothetical protein
MRNRVLVLALVILFLSVGNLVSGRRLMAQEKNSDEHQRAEVKPAADVPQGPYGGSVNVDQKGSDLPATLLAAQAVKNAALKIVTDLADIQKGTCLVFASAEIPTFQNYVLYEIQLTAAKNALATALADSKKLLEDELQPHTEAKVEGLETVFPSIFGIVGQNLDAIDKLLGFFRTDYTVGGVEVSFDDSTLVLETAKQLRQPQAGWNVRLPAIYDPRAFIDSVNKIKEDFSSIANDRIKALSQAKYWEEKIIEAQASTPKDKKRITREEDVKNNLEHAAEFGNQFYSKMTSVSESDKSATVPISIIAREKAIFDTLSGESPAYLLILHIHKTGGGYLVKKNLLTALFGSIPLYYVGGTVVTYALFRGLDGSLCKSGLIPMYGGYVKASKIQTALHDLSPANAGPRK